MRRPANAGQIGAAIAAAAAQIDEPFARAAMLGDGIYAHPLHSGCIPVGRARVGGGVLTIWRRHTAVLGVCDPSSASSACRASAQQHASRCGSTSPVETADISDAFLRVTCDDTESLSSVRRRTTMSRVCRHTDKNIFDVHRTSFI